MRRPGRRVRVGAALAIALLGAGGVTAAVNQGGDDSSTAVSARPDEATLDGLDSGTSGARPVERRAYAVRSSSATGGGESVTAVDESASMAPSPAGPNGPRIVKRADIRVEVREKGFRAAFERAAAVAGAHGGFVASSTSRTADEDDDKADPAAGTLVLRVPASAFDAARAELAGLGDVTSEVIDGEDVSGQLVDLDARIRSLQVEEEALRTLMVKAKTVGETIEVQQQLTRVRQQIEQAAGQRAT